MENYSEIVKRQWDNYTKSAHYSNIMLLGCTSCGKSTLINTVFGKHVAEVSDTSRGTEDFNVYSGADNNTTVNFIDSKGYEMGGNNPLDEYIDNLHKWIDKHKNTPEKVHLVWYCISATSAVIQNIDTKIIETIYNERLLKNKIAVVITQCDQDDENGSAASAIRDVVHQDISNSIPVFEVSREKDLRLDLSQLIQWSADNLDDDEIRKMFVAAQMVDLSTKKKKAVGIIMAAVTASAATGALPIPGADAPILTAAQVAMSAAIIGSYGLNMAAGVITTLVGDTLVSNLGKAAVGSILKFFPGVGSVVGGVINAGVAASITSALGIAISEICYSVCKKIAAGESVDLETALNSDAIKTAMKIASSKLNDSNEKDAKHIVETYGEEINADGK